MARAFGALALGGLPKPRPRQIIAAMFLTEFAMSQRFPTYFISHGGGPWPWLRDMRRMFSNLEGSPARGPSELPAGPQGVLSISAHGEGPAFAGMSSRRPPMVYDYSG